MSTEKKRTLETANSLAHDPQQTAILVATTIKDVLKRWARVNAYCVLPPSRNPGYTHHSIGIVIATEGMNASRKEALRERVKRAIAHFDDPDPDGGVYIFVKVLNEYEFKRVKNPGSYIWIRREKGRS